MRNQARGDAGETLIELLVSITILGLAGVSLLGGLALAITASDMQQKETTGGAYVRSYAESLSKYIATYGNYVACASPSTYSSGVSFAPPSGYTAKVTSIRSVSSTGALVSFTSPCGTSDTGVQAVTLSVASTDNRANEQLMVIVRKPCNAPASSGPGTGTTPC